MNLSDVIKRPLITEKATSLKAISRRKVRERR